MTEGLKSSGEQIRVEIVTPRNRIVGTVFTLASAYHSRLSDLLNQKGVSFLSVTKADVYEEDPNAPAYSCEYIAVSLASIDTIRPID